MGPDPEVKLQSDQAGLVKLVGRAAPFGSWILVLIEMSSSDAFQFYKSPIEHGVLQELTDLMHTPCRRHQERNCFWCGATQPKRRCLCAFRLPPHCSSSTGTCGNSLDERGSLVNALPWRPCHAAREPHPPCRAPRSSCPAATDAIWYS